MFLPNLAKTGIKMPKEDLKYQGEFSQQKFPPAFLGDIRIPQLVIFPII
jgi:hypothetical protein